MASPQFNSRGFHLFELPVLLDSLLLLIELLVDAKLRFNFLQSLEENLVER